MVNHTQHENATLSEHHAALTAALSSEWLEKAKNYALKCHEETNHTYDGKPYAVHLQIAFDYACKYAYLLPLNALLNVLAATWTHDIIEDCRQTYNDVKAVVGIEIAEITYALTNEKGRTRKERANSRYYEGIRNTPFATFVKLCDRLANAKYSKEKGTRMIEAYRKEHEEFKAELFSEDYEPMWDELWELVSV